MKTKNHKKGALSMKAIILAGGYAKRLWPLTKDKPKQLLSVGGRPIIEYIMEKLEAQKEIDKIIISTNEKFEDNFKEWLLGYKSPKNIELVIEPTLSEKDKLGSVGALGYLIRGKNIDEELMIIGGDNLFEFDLINLINYYREKKGNAVALYDLKSIQEAQNYGVAKVDEEMRIIDFVEKPKNPPSTLVSTACYVLSQEGVRGILTYLDKGENPDAIGFFIKLLIKREKVFGFVFSGRWFDIGSLESLKKADLIYSKNKGEDL
jgi:glucose-1-phosphate thymidylyltransferase